jgi:hypothetical protein
LFAEQETESVLDLLMIILIAVQGKWKHSSWNDDKFCLHNGKMILIFTELWYFWYCKRKMFFFMINFDTATGKWYLNSFYNDKFWYRSGSSFLVWKIKSFLNHNYKLCRPDPNSEYGFTDLIGSRFNTDRDAPPCSILIFIQENKSVHRGMMLKFVCASGNPYNDVKFCLRNRKRRVFLIW